jgi:hypothetical protein
MSASQMLTKNSINEILENSECVKLGNIFPPLMGKNTKIAIPKFAVIYFFT